MVSQKRRVQVEYGQNIVQGHILKSVVKRNDDCVKHDNVSNDQTYNRTYNHYHYYKLLPTAQNLGPSSCNGKKKLHLQFNIGRDVESKVNYGNRQFVT